MQDNLITKIASSFLLQFLKNLDENLFFNKTSLFFFCFFDKNTVLQLQET